MPNTDIHPDLVTPDQAARSLGFSNTIAFMRAAARAGAPKKIRIGRRVFFRRADLDAYIDAKATAPEGTTAS